MVAGENIGHTRLRTLRRASARSDWILTTKVSRAIA